MSVYRIVKETDNDGFGDTRYYPQIRKSFEWFKILNIFSIIVILPILEDLIKYFFKKDFDYIFKEKSVLSSGTVYSFKTESEALNFILDEIRKEEDEIKKHEERKKKNKIHKKK